MKLLISLPYLASTCKYSKYFPFPLALLKYKKDKDELIDYNLLAYKKTKEEIYKITDDAIKKVNEFEGGDIIVNCGDQAPDGDKYEFFEYFFSKINKNVKLIGPYCVFKQRISKFECVELLEEYTNTYGIMIPKDMLERYPDAELVLRATMRISNGCPRSCNFCMVPIIHGGKYKMEPIDTSIAMIKEYYDMGVRLITFIDDNMGVNKKKFKQFLQDIKALNLKGMKFISLEGFETYMFEDEEICWLLKETKWQNIKTGMENINENFLKKVNKYYDDHQVIVRAMENVRKYNLDVSVYYLIGLDETEDIVMENIRFISKYRLGVRVNILRPYENGLLDFNSFQRKMNMKTMKHLSSLCYAVSWIATNHDVDIFEEGAFEKALDKCELEYINKDSIITFTGKVYIGFKTSKLIKVLTYMLEQKYGKIKRIEDNRERIVFEIQKEVKTQIVDDLFE